MRAPLFINILCFGAAEGLKSQYFRKHKRCFSPHTLKDEQKLFIFSKMFYIVASWRQCLDIMNKIRLPRGMHWELIYSVGICFDGKRVNGGGVSTKRQLNAKDRVCTIKHPRVGSLLPFNPQLTPMPETHVRFSLAFVRHFPRCFRNVSCKKSF